MLLDSSKARKSPPALSELLSKRLVNRGRLLRKEAHAVVSHVDAVLEPDAELAGDRDHRLVAEAHPGRERRRVALGEVRPLVPVEADAVAGAVGEARQLVVRSIPVALLRFSRG